MKQNFINFSHSELNNKLGAGFAVIIILVLILSYTFLSSLNVLKESVEEYIYNNAGKIHLISEMRLYTRERNLILLKVLQYPDVFERDNLHTAYYQYGSRFAKARKLFETNMNPTEQKLFNNVILNVRKVIPHQLEVLNLALQEKDKPAQKILDEKLSHTQQRVIESLDKIYDYQYKNSKYFYDNISTQTQENHISIIILSLAILITAFFIAYTAVARNKVFFKLLQTPTSKAPAPFSKMQNTSALVHDVTQLLKEKSNKHLKPVTIEQKHNSKMNPG